MLSRPQPLLREIEQALPERPFGVRLWDGTTLPPTNGGGPTFEVRSPDAFAHALLAPGQLGLGRAYVSGTLDVEAVMRNLNEFVRKSGGALGNATGQTAPKPLSEEDIRKVADVVRDPKFNVYVGEDDDIIRRVAGKIEFDVPEANREGLGGIESGAIEFEVEFTNVNGDQQIEAPANARPISSLTRSLGGTPGLGGVVTDEGGGPAPANPGDGQAGGPGTEDFQEYADCLDKARPEDTEALQRCAELLQTP